MTYHVSSGTLNHTHSLTYEYLAATYLTKTMYTVVGLSAVAYLGFWKWGAKYRLSADGVNGGLASRWG